MPSEQQIQTKIKTYLEEEGAYVVKVIHASKKGVPDLLVCYKGFFIGIEVKRPSTLHSVSALQKFNLKKIKEAQGLSLVASSVEDVADFLVVIKDRDG